MWIRHVLPPSPVISLHVCGIINPFYFPLPAFLWPTIDPGTQNLHFPPPRPRIEPEPWPSAFALRQLFYMFPPLCFPSGTKSSLCCGWPILALFSHSPALGLPSFLLYFPTPPFAFQFPLSHTRGPLDVIPKRPSAFFGLLSICVFYFRFLSLHPLPFIVAINSAFFRLSPFSLFQGHRTPRRILEKHDDDVFRFNPFPRCVTSPPFPRLCFFQLSWHALKITFPDAHNSVFFP